MKGWRAWGDSNARPLVPEFWERCDKEKDGEGSSDTPDKE